MMNENKSLCILTLRVFFSLLIVAALLFLSAGTFDFSAAWVFLVAVSCIGLLFALWLYIRNPLQFQNRLHPTEPDKVQQRLVLMIGVTLCLSLIVSGLDKRFGWSHISDWRYLVAGVLACGAALIYHNVFKCNPYLSNTVEIHENHKVIDQGMYGVVRHPMYLATCMTCAAGMVMLGSLATVPMYVIFFCLMLIRAKREETQLVEALPEYRSYMEKVKHRIIPYAL